MTGVGLHSGLPSSLEFRQGSGPVAFVDGDRLAQRSSLRILRADHGVSVELPESGRCIDLVEHVFAALGGLGVQQHVCLSVTGCEIPLLDGGAQVLTAALLGLGAPADVPPLKIVRPFSVEIGQARYWFEPADEISVEVEVTFAPLAPQHAEWDGSSDQFVESIAPARTFGFLRDRGRLERAGRAHHVDPRSVLILDDDGGVHPACAPMTPMELARHKLLDFIGDSYLFGGPPVGRVRAERPGHRATHAALDRALRAGALELTQPDFAAHRSVGRRTSERGCGTGPQKSGTNF